MADVKQILVVDDHFEVLEFLRSMLELSGQDYEVLAVPSAEEGLLELHRTKFDLLITDARLPGMSGFDLVRRVQRVNPGMAVIMITAYSTPQGKQEADSLGVYRYFAKPLDTDAVLAAVYTALYGETAEPPPPAARPQRPVSKTAVSNQIQYRLDGLRAETGATGLILARLNGEILYQAGRNTTPIDLDKLVAIVSRNVENSFNLAQPLGGEVPFTIQYHAGTNYELYNANIGRHFFITMYFDVKARRGRIGTIWVFSQRAIKDLFELLAAPDDKPVMLAEQPRPSNPAPPPPPAHRPQPAPEPEIDYDAERALIDELPSWSDLEPEELETEGDLSELLAALNLSEEATAVDLDNFWEEVVEEPDNGGQGLSLEEAMKQGLFSPDDEAPEEDN
jgi:DNA-binding response OmpR family regulator